MTVRNFYDEIARAECEEIFVLEAARLYAIVIRMRNSANVTTVLSVRVSPDERAMLEAAAEQSRASLSDFVRRKALEAAELEVLNRSIITIPTEDWEAFEAWANRPAVANPAFEELARRKPSWER